MYMEEPDQRFISGAPPKEISVVSFKTTAFSSQRSLQSGMQQSTQIITLPNLIQTKLKTQSSCMTNRLQKYLCKSALYYFSIAWKYASNSSILFLLPPPLSFLYFSGWSCGGRENNFKPLDPPFWFLKENGQFLTATEKINSLKLLCSLPGMCESLHKQFPFEKIKYCQINSEAC